MCLFFSVYQVHLQYFDPIINIIVVLCQNEVCVFKAFFSIIIITDKVLTILYVVSGHMIYNQTNSYHFSIYKSVTGCTENLLLRFSQFHKICSYDLLAITPRYFRYRMSDSCGPQRLFRNVNHFVQYISIIGIILSIFPYRTFNMHTYGDLDIHDIHK